MSARPGSATPDDTNPTALTPEREQDIRKRRVQAKQVLAEGEGMPVADYRLISQTFTDMAVVLAELDRVRAELDSPAVEVKRNEVRQSYLDLAAQAREDRDYEGAFNVDCTLREREEQWAAEDATFAEMQRANGNPIGGA